MEEIALIGLGALLILGLFSCLLVSATFCRRGWRLCGPSAAADHLPRRFRAGEEEEGEAEEEEEEDRRRPGAAAPPAYAEVVAAESPPPSYAAATRKIFRVDVRSFFPAEAEGSEPGAAAGEANGVRF
jgi:hypothetical protein